MILPLFFQDKDLSRWVCLRIWQNNFPVVVDTFLEASNVLGYDLWDRVQNGPADLLNQTTCTQPAMLAAGVSVWRCWQQQNTTLPALMAGHSLGEYTALVCADSIAFTDAIGLVRRRGELMQNAVPEGSGAMAAILGLDDAMVTDVCERAAEGEVVSAVNFNSPGQVVIAGNTAAIERAMELAKEVGAKRALLLPVSVPSHCALMTGAAESFAKELQMIEVKTPAIPVIHNMDVASHSDANANSCIPCRATTQTSALGGYHSTNATDGYFQGI